MLIGLCPGIISDFVWAARAMLVSEVTNEVEKVGAKQMDAAKQLIILIGICGVGKTYFAEKVARALGLGWLDLDALIAQQSGITMAQLQAGEHAPESSQGAPSQELYSSAGESFRALESQWLKAAMGARNHVVALGGGSLLAPHNQQVLQRSGGLVIWLTEELQLIAQRLASQPIEACLVSRPLLKAAVDQMEVQQPGLDMNEYLQLALAALYSQRQPGYVQVADLTVDLSFVSTDIAVGMLSSQIKAMWDKARNNHHDRAKPHE